MTSDAPRMPACPARTIALPSESAAYYCQTMPVSEAYARSCARKRNAQRLNEDRVSPITARIELLMVLCPCDDNPPCEVPLRARSFAPEPQSGKVVACRDRFEVWRELRVVESFEGARETLVRLEELGLNAGNVRQERELGYLRTHSLAVPRGRCTTSNR